MSMWCAWPTKAAQAGDGRLGHKRLQHWILLGGCECRRSEGLDVEGDGGADIRKRRLVSVALADDGATRQAQRISDVAIRVFFDDDFQWWCHAGRMLRESDLGKRAKSPNDPKLSDGRGWRDRCTVGGKAEAEAAGVTAAHVRCSA